MKLYAILFGMICYVPGMGAELSVGSGAGSLVLVNGAHEFWRFHGSAVGVEVPFGYDGWERTSLDAHASYFGFYKERFKVGVTPGIRVRFRTERRFSPWAAMGAGGVILQRTGVSEQYGTLSASQRDTNLVFAMAPGLGLDLRVKAKWFVRVEARTHFFQTPTNGFVAAFPYWGRWNYNPVAAIGLGWRM